MKKVPEMYKKIVNAIEEECSENCQDCVFHLNGMCDEIVEFVQKMAEVVSENRKIMQRK